jgi:regulatory protein
MTDDLKKCFDAAQRALAARPYSTHDLRRKLLQKKFAAGIVDQALDRLTKLAFLSDEKYAHAKALSAAAHKRYGRRRAAAELARAGIAGDVADRALDAVYDKTDTTAVARALAEKHASRLKRLEPQTARRRLLGMLQRRGFEYDEVRQVIDAVLGSEQPSRLR